jgi:uncharacterized membrane protein
MATLWAVGIQGLVLVVIAAVLLLMPSLTRRDLLFGVTVSPHARETPEGRAIIRRYRFGVLLIVIAQATGLAFLWALAPALFWASAWITVIPLALVLMPNIPYLLAWRSARALATALPPVSTPAPSAELRPRHYADYVPLLWEALPLALIALTASYLAITYAAAPAIIPTHFDAAGNPNDYATKSIGSYFLLVWTQLFLFVLITYLSLLTVRAKAQPTAHDETFRRRTLRYLFGVKTMMIALMGALAYAVTQSALSGHADINWALWVVLGGVVVVLAGAIWLGVTTGQGGSRLGGKSQNSESATDRIDDRYWKLGAIYANPDDPAIFVEKRYGLGWTINVGNPRALLVMLVILALPLAFVVFTFVAVGK